jgi:hypothetical protein
MKAAPIILRIGSTLSRGLNRGDVDLAHRHHRFEHSLASGGIGIGHAIGKGARGDLPRQAPLVLAPAALALLPAVADDGVPQPIGLGLVVGGDLEREGLAVLELRAAVEADAGNPADGDSTVSTSPCLPLGKSAGARWIAPTLLSGKVAA